MTTENRLDIIVFGATGYTGKYAARQMANFAKTRPDCTWGVAGRNKEKLEEILKEVTEKTGESVKGVEVIVANVDDADSLAAMAKRARVVINCVGPYIFYGEQVVKACVEAGTHQVDVSGEPLYIETMLKKYDEMARENKTYIISACGFDSIPSDMGVVYAKQHFEGQINSIEVYLDSKIEGPRSQGPQINIGTWDSLVHGVANQKKLKALRKEIYKEPLPKMKPKLEHRSIVHKNREASRGKWYIPFLGSDKSIVTRSQRYFYFNENQRPIQFNIYVGIGNFIQTLMFIMIASIIGLFAQFSIGRNLLKKYPKYFSFGFFDRDAVPDEEGNKQKKFSLYFIADGWKNILPNPTDEYSEKPNRKVHFKVSGVDPGYYSTTAALVQSALTILDEKDKLPGDGGVFSPGAAFAKTKLINNLQKCGIQFEKIKETDYIKKNNQTEIKTKLNKEE